MINGESFNDLVSGSAFPEWEELIRVVAFLEGLNLSASDVGEVSERLNTLISKIVVPAAEINYKSTWYRARKCKGETGFSNLREMIYRQDPGRCFGRASMPGLGAFYASNNASIALEEINAKAGDVVQLIAVRVIPEKKVLLQPIGCLHSILLSGRFAMIPQSYKDSVFSALRANKDLVQRHQYVDAFLSRIFRRALSRRDSEYMISAMYSDALFSRGVGVFYPSVAAVGGENFAVCPRLFDSSFEVVATALESVERYLGDGIFITQTIGRTGIFAENGDIDWSDERSPLLARNANGGVRFPESVMGWRVP